MIKHLASNQGTEFDSHILLKINNNMDAESAYLLQKIDCNCNTCFYFKRDIEKTKLLNTNDKIKANKIHYGFCEKLEKYVCEIANICLVDTQECFVHRKDK